MLTTEQNFILNVLSDHLSERKTETIPPDMDWDLIISTIDNHQIDGIFVYQTQKLCPKSLATQMMQKNMKNIYFATNRKVILAKIHNQFCKENIPYLIVKGTEIADLYPVPVLRSMGDLDILVHLEDKQRAHDALLAIGFVNDTISQNEWIYYYGDRSCGMEVEIHSHLAVEDTLTTREIEDFSNQVWEYAASEDGLCYHLNWTYHLVFLLIHLRKHLLSSGIGLRQFFDLAIVAKHESIDDAAFIEMTKDLCLYDFACTCFAFLARWFGVKFDFLPAVSLDDSFYQQGTESIFANGVFGYQNEKNKDNYKMVEISNNQKTGRFGAIIKTILPSYQTLRVMPKYHYLDGRPYLLPYVWVSRMLKVLFEKRTASTMTALNHYMTISDEDLRARDEYLKNWGLTSGKIS